MILAIRHGKRVGLAFEDVIIVAAFAIGFALLGGWLMFIFVTFSISDIIAFIKAGDFSFLQGGIVFYGGLIGGMLSVFFSLKVIKRPFAVVEQCIVPYIPLGHAIGRVGCVMAGCCHGAPYDGPLALYYPNSVLGVDPHQGYFPTQLLEALLNVGICFCLIAYRKKARRSGDILFGYLALYSVVRFILEFFRGDAIRGIAGGLSTSQWISVGLFALVVARLLFFKFKKTADKESA